MAINKREQKLDKNRGRAYATNTGISMARGDWCLFIRSNETFSSNLILEYKKTMAKKDRASERFTDLSMGYSIDPEDKRTDEEITKDMEKAGTKVIRLSKKPSWAS